MNPSSDRAMIRTSTTSPALTVLLISAMALSGCSVFSGKPTPVTLPNGASTQGQTPANAAKKTIPKPIDKGDPDARFRAALDQLKQGQLQDGEAALTELVKDFPQYSGPLTNLGLIYVQSKRFDLAASAFAKAVTDNPQNAVAYNWLGMLYREANNYGRAEQAYKQALSANPDYGYAHLNLGILYDVYLKRPADALQQYKEYQRLGGADDLRVLVWVADLEKTLASAQPVSPAAAPAAGQPATVAPSAQPKPMEKKP